MLDSSVIETINVNAIGRRQARENNKITIEIAKLENEYFPKTLFLIIK
jgi:hypothetical protein